MAKSNTKPPLLFHVSFKRSMLMATSATAHTTTIDAIRYGANIRDIPEHIETSMRRQTQQHNPLA